MNKYSIGDILKRKEVGEYGEMWFEITQTDKESKDGLNAGITRNKDWEVLFTGKYATQWLETYYTPAPDEIKVGDVVMDRNDGEEYAVIARVGKIFATSFPALDNIKLYEEDYFTKKFIKIDKTTPRTLTQEEATKILEEKLGEKIIIK